MAALVAQLNPYKVKISVKHSVKDSKEGEINAVLDPIVVFGVAINDRKYSKRLPGLLAVWGGGFGAILSAVRWQHLIHIMQLNYFMSNTCKTNLAFKFAEDDQTTPKRCHYSFLAYGSETSGGGISIPPFGMRRISRSAGSKLHFIDFIHLISQSMFNWHRKHKPTGINKSERGSQRERRRFGLFSHATLPPGRRSRRRARCYFLFHSASFAL